MERGTPMSNSTARKAQQAAEGDAGPAGVYISLDALKEWREDAEQRANRADSHLVFAARILRLIDALEAPCGSCHPCNNWANQTWVNANERLPHLHEWQEMRAELQALRDSPECQCVRCRDFRAIQADAFPSGVDQ